MKLIFLNIFAHTFNWRITRSQEDQTLNMFVEWMAGGSVAGLLDRHGPFAEAVILRYARQVLVGVEHLHSWGILHRDLKGANLLLDSTGRHLRIADLGAAARMSLPDSLKGEFQGQLQVGPGGGIHGQFLEP